MSKKISLLLMSLLLIVVSVFSQIIAAPTTPDGKSLVNLDSGSAVKHKISNLQAFGLGVLGTAGAAFAISELKGHSRQLSTAAPTPAPIPPKPADVYVVDRNNNRVQKFNTNGDFLLAWTSPNFAAPDFDAVDDSGNVYVADTTNDIVAKFDSNGNEITTGWPIAIGNPRGVVATDSFNHLYVADNAGPNDRIRKFNSGGSEVIGGNWPISITGNPVGIATDRSGNIYVSDNAGVNSDIIKFDPDGNQLASVTFTNSNFLGITVDSAGNIYAVEDNPNDRIRKFDSNINEIIAGNWPLSISGNPFDVAADDFDNVYVTDRAKDRVLKFNSEGVFIKMWSSVGSAVGELDNPRGIAIKRSS